MIDIESPIFDKISAELRQRFSPLFITGEYVKVPSSFPCVSLVEIDNATLRNTQTSSVNENHVAVTYELNVYSNKTKGKKSECKEIAGCVCELLGQLNFTRIMLEPIPNLDDTTIYRMVGRFRAVIGQNLTIFRR